MMTQLLTQKKDSSQLSQDALGALSFVTKLESLMLLSKCGASELQRCDHKLSMAEYSLLCDTGHSRKGVSQK